MKFLNFNPMQQCMVCRYKGIAILVLSFSLLIACNSPEKKEGKTNESATEMDAHHEHESDAALTLNNGAKWKSDISTNENVAALKNIIAATTPTTLEEYHAAGKELQAGINKMISECRMQGADHDALHLWLEPLMATNKKLQASSSVDEGSKSFESIKEQINLYSQFFE